MRSKWRTQPEAAAGVADASVVARDVKPHVAGERTITIASDPRLGAVTPQWWETPPHDASVLTSATLARGTSVGRFVVLDVLGSGGMAVVYKAYDPALRREVALKFLRPGAGERSSSDIVLVREAQAMAQLSHPNVVAVFDAITFTEHVVIAMEYVRGQTLARWLEPVGEQQRPWREVLEAFVQAGHGLAAAHRVGLVHRDFKPSNVLVSEEGRILVTDFGIARGRSFDHENDLDPTRQRVGVSLSQGAEQAPSLVVGTPRFMAPEQHRRREAAAPADQYAFCVALWQALTGTLPFSGTDLLDLERAKLIGPPAWPKATRVPSRVIAAIARGLAPRPEQRWPSMDALLDALAHETRAQRRRWRAAALAVPALGAWLWSWHSESAAQCSGAHAHLHGIWDDARRDDVRAALLRTEVAFAPDTWSRVAAMLDDYAGAWMEQHRATCEATVVEGVQPADVMDLRMSCLQRRKVELQAAVEVLAAADPQVVEKAVQLVADLPSLRRCADVAALQAEVPPPEDPGDAAIVTRARDLLARASAQSLAGRYASAGEHVDAAAALLRDVAYAPTQTELDHRKGVLLQQQGQYQASAEALERAFVSALGSGRMDLAAASASHLAVVIGERQARVAEGLPLAELSLALAGASGNDSEAEARDNLGNVLHARGRYDEAAEQYHQALALREQLLGPDDPRVATFHNNVGIMRAERGRYAEAETELRAAHVLRERVLGREHPDTTDTQLNLGNVLQERGRYSEAEAAYRDALVLREKNLGPEHPRVVDVKSSLAMALLELGRHEEAEAELRSAIEVLTKLLGEEHPKVVASRGNLGIVLLEQQRHGEAEELLRAAAKQLAKSVGPRHPWVAHFRSSIGRALLARGRHEEARAELSEALVLFQNSMGPHHPGLAGMLLDLARVAMAGGAEVDARRHLERASAIDAAPPRARAEVAFALAKLLWQSPGDRSHALQLAERAQEFYARVEGAQERQDEIRAWLEARGESSSRSDTR